MRICFHRPPPLSINPKPPLFTPCAASSYLFIMCCSSPFTSLSERVTPPLNFAPTCVLCFSSAIDPQMARNSLVLFYFLEGVMQLQTSDIGLNTYYISALCY